MTSHFSKHMFNVGSPLDLTCIHIARKRNGGSTQKNKDKHKHRKLFCLLYASQQVLTQSYQNFPEGELKHPSMQHSLPPLLIYQKRIDS